MLKIRWAKVLRELWGNKARSILVILSISVGVFAIGTIANSWAVLVDDLNDQYNATNPASATLTLTPFENDLVSAVESRRDIAQAEARATFTATMTTPDGELFNLSLDAVPDFNNLQISQFTLEEGAWPPARRQVLMERSYVAAFGYEIGDTVRIETADGRNYDLVLAGIVHDLHVTPAGNGEIAYAYISMDTLEYLGQPGTYNRLFITVAENQLDKNYIESVVTDLREETLTRAGYTVFAAVVPNPGEAFLAVIIRAILFTLALIGAFSLVLSGALVVNTVSAVIARQTKQIGVMKAIGGQQDQIGEIYFVSVAIYGLASLLVAVPLALLGSRLFTSIIARTVNFDIITTQIPAFVIILEVIIAILVPLLAASIPVRAAMNITVREAIDDYGIDGGTETGFDRIMRKMKQGSVSMAMALRNTFRRKARLLLTLLTLTLAGAIFISVLSVRDSLFGTFETALGYYGYDLSVDLTEDYRTELIAREADRIETVAAVEGWLQRGAARERADGSQSTNYSLIGAPIDSSFIDPILTEGRWVTENDRNAVVVNQDFISAEEDVQVGDTITLQIDGESTDWTVVGICTTQYSFPVMYTAINDLGRTLNTVGFANRVLIQLTEQTPGVETATAARIEDRFKLAGLLVGTTTTRSDFIETFSFRFNFLIYFLVFLAFLLALVGGMGLAGTMSLNVLERVREIGVMRAIGASNRKVQRIVISEGLVIGAISWVMAIVAAIPLAAGLAYGIGVAFGGTPLQFEFSAIGTGIWLALALIIAALASYAPARRASALTVREVLAYD